MNNLQYYVIQEGGYVEPEVVELFKEQLSYGDLERKNDYFVSKFTGIIINSKSFLISFPKHYLNESELMSLQDNQGVLVEHIKTLFKLLIKVDSREKSKQFGRSPSINTTYPFYYFFKILKYYKKYGLYKEYEKKNVKGYSGKINWKKTIKKSPSIYSQGNLIYIPFYLKKKESKHVFISDCMAYAINKTIKNFHILIKENIVLPDNLSIDWDNSEDISNQLKKILPNMFKDEEKDLVRNLILFFDNTSKGSRHMEIKTYNFNLIWENMVGIFLNDKFQDVDNEGFIIWNEFKNKYPKNFKKGEFHPDARYESGEKTYRLEPDHYLYIDKKMFLFDSKYYNKVNGLDYKQISYYFLLKDYYQLDDNDSKYKVYNILLLPTSRSRNSHENKKIHFILNPEFNKSEENFYILEQYVNMKDVIDNYLN